MTKEELEKEAYKEAEKIKECQTEPNNEYEKGFNNGEVRGYKDGYRDGAEPREKRIAELKNEVHTWKEASENNSYKAFQLQEENKMLSKHILELQNDKGELTDRCRELEAQIEKMKCCGNCNKLRGRFDSKTNINILYCSDSDMKQIEVGFQMCCCKWEMKENE